MKITVGMGSIDDYPEFVRAGADEVFIGYVPRIWQERFGLQTPLNRREVCNYNVQIGAQEELEILSEMVKELGVPVTAAFNGLSFREEQYPVIGEIMEECLSFGIRSVIAADPGLLLYLHETGLSEKLSIHLSGEFGEISHYAVKELRALGISRLIFHRKVSLSSMEKIINAIKAEEAETGEKQLEYEAFILNENCHFHGAYCSSLHCDELVPMCRMPYRLAGAETLPAEADRARSEEEAGEAFEEDGSFYDYGLSKLRELQRIGITHLKIAGRGAYTEDMIKSIVLVKKYLSAG